MALAPEKMLKIVGVLSHASPMSVCNIAASFGHASDLG
jgi:hypothetical protein